MAKAAQREAVAHVLQALKQQIIGFRRVEIGLTAVTAEGLGSGTGRIVGNVAGHWA
jgi:hypothetical protein